MDPGLDFSRLPALKEMYERCTKMRVPERQPYAGELVFTAFSGSHQDAINKGMQYMRDSGTEYWEIPYLPIDPADVGRQYEPIIRINSQSGKGGAAFVMQTVFGYNLPKAMHPEFGALVKAECDRPAGSSPPTSCSACSAGIIWKCRGHTPWPGILCSRNRVARTACISKAP